MLKQCEKFGFTTLKEDLDKRIANKVDAMCSSLCRGPNSLSFEFIFVNGNSGVLAAVKEFELPKSEVALAS